jgi:ribosome biogenesis GTPase
MPLQVESWGYVTIPVSAASGEGLDRLAGVLQGHVSVIAGPSGVGKSSLINAIKLQAAYPGSAKAVAMAAKPEESARTCGGQGSSVSGSNGSSAGVDGSADRRKEEHSEMEGQPASAQAAAGGNGAPDDRGLAQEVLRGNANMPSNGARGESGLGDHLSDESPRPTNDIGPGRSNEEGESSGRQDDSSERRILEPVEQWRGLQAAAEKLGLQPVGDLTNIGRGKHTTRHVSLLEVGPLEGSV